MCESLRSPCSSVVSNTGPAGTLSSVGGPTSQVLEFTQSDKDAIADMSRDPDLYRKMVRSIAPTVYGHDEVKRGILLMLLGGVPKRTPDGSRCACVRTVFRYATTFVRCVLAG